MKTAIVLLGLLVVSLAATTATSDENAGDALVRQISGMEDALHNEQSSHDDLFHSQQGDCDVEVSFRTAEIEAGNNALSASQSAQAKCENAQTSANQDLVNAHNYIETINEILSQEVFKRNQDQHTFETVVNNQLTPALEALAGIYPIINGISEEVVSFVQISTHMNKLFNHMAKAKRAAQFGHVIAFLIQQETEEGAIANDDLSDLLPLLYQIEDDLQAQKTAAIEANDASIDSYNQLVVQYNAVLSNLHGTIENINNYLDELASCVAVETQVSSDATVKVQHNTDSLNHALDMCNSLLTEYQNAGGARQAELLLLGKLKSFVQEETEVFGDFGNDGQEALQQYQASFAQTQSVHRAQFLQKSLLRIKKSPVVQYMCKSCKKNLLQKNLGF